MHYFCNVVHFEYKILLLVYKIGRAFPKIVYCNNQGKK